jgi:hypothetical protein
MWLSLEADRRLPDIRTPEPVLIRLRPNSPHARLASESHNTNRRFPLARCFPWDPEALGH